MGLRWPARPAGLGESCRPGPSSAHTPGPGFVLIPAPLPPGNYTSRSPWQRQCGHTRVHAAPPETGAGGDITSHGREHLSLLTSINIYVSISAENLIRLPMTPARCGPALLPARGPGWWPQSRWFGSLHSSGPGQLTGGASGSPDMGQSWVQRQGPGVEMVGSVQGPDHVGREGVSPRSGALHLSARP